MEILQERCMLDDSLQATGKQKLLSTPMIACVPAEDVLACSLSFLRIRNSSSTRKILNGKHATWGLLCVALLSQREQQELSNTIAKIWRKYLWQLYSGLGHQYAEDRKPRNWLFDLLTTGSWIGAADEYHHYANDNGSSKQTSLSLGWGDSLRQLTHIPQWIAVSATPNRKSGETIFGDPVIDVSYADGLQEGNILKDVSIHVREFSVDTEDIQGHQQTYTTSELREEIGTEDIDTWGSAAPVALSDTICLANYRTCYSRT